MRGASINKDESDCNSVLAGLCVAAASLEGDFAFLSFQWHMGNKPHRGAKTGRKTLGKRGDGERKCSSNKTC